MKRPHFILKREKNKRLSRRKTPPTFKIVIRHLTVAEIKRAIRKLLAWKNHVILHSQMLGANIL